MNMNDAFHVSKLLFEGIVIPIFVEGVWFVCDNVQMGNLVFSCIVSPCQGKV